MAAECPTMNIGLQSFLVSRTEYMQNAIIGRKNLKIFYHRHLPIPAQLWSCSPVFMAPRSACRHRHFHPRHSHGWGVRTQSGRYFVEREASIDLFRKCGNAHSPMLKGGWVTSRHRRKRQRCFVKTEGQQDANYPRHSSALRSKGSIETAY